MAGTPDRRVVITTKRTWTVLRADEDGGTSHVELAPGSHEMELIRCPTGHDCNWYVLVGTKIGGAVGWWQDFTKEDVASEFHVDITRSS